MPSQQRENRRDVKERNPTSAAPVSVHGGHSGQFCTHASDSLEEIVRAYIRKGFKWVGLTEHIPPVSEAFLYPEEIEEGLTPERVHDRFSEYISVARELQVKYRDSLRLLVGFETECYTGYGAHVARLRRRFQPDYIVGSVHHVRDIVIDGTPASYADAVAEVGSIDALFCEYFDRQYELLEVLKPEVVGHFDLIRMHDKDYRQRLEKPGIRAKVRRNLEKIKALGSILDFNVRAFEKGGNEPYVSGSILEMALTLGIPCVPGDDSHGVAGVGRNLERGIDILARHGFSTAWPMPGGCGT